MSSLSSFETKAFRRPTLALHVLSDVFPEGGDFDAGLTTDYRHLRPKDTRDGIGDDPVLGAYGVELIAQLVDDAHEQIRKAVREAQLESRFLWKKKLHPDVRRAYDAFRSGAIRVIANNAPRTEDNQSNNGDNFWLALLDNGVEVYATPLQLLRYVKHRVVSLFEIPNQGHPHFDGSREQFRSSLIARSGQVPGHLRRARPALLTSAFRDKPELEFVYGDPYGNKRLRTDNIAQVRELLRRLAIGHELPRIGLIVGENRKFVSAVVGNSLSSIPDGEWGLYRNVADGERTEGPGYYELVHKWKGEERYDAHEELGKPPLGSSIELQVPSLVEQA